MGNLSCMAAIATWIASNPFVVLLVVAICTTILKVRRSGRTAGLAGVSYIAWGELLVYAVGVWFILAGIGHAYFQQFVAPKIGWQPSPFEYELGWIEIPLGFVAIVALWRGYEFRLAATIVVATFALAAAAQHIQQIICCGNHAESNAGPVLWLGDIAIPIVLLILAASSSRAPTPSSPSGGGKAPEAF